MPRRVEVLAQLTPPSAVRTPIGPSVDPYEGMPMATQFRGVEQTTDTRGIPRDAGGTDPVARCGGVSAPAVPNDAKRPASTSGMQRHLIDCLFIVWKTLWRLA